MTVKPRTRQFHELMPHRMREVLLCSSRYDAFVLQEDGHLTEQIFLEYKELSLSSSPRVTHAASPQEAFDMLESYRFDLVLVVRRVSDVDVVRFSRQVKARYPKLPIVVLGFEGDDLLRLRPSVGSQAIDSLFLWNGDSKILLGIIKHIEDRKNIDNDIEVAHVRVILVVEDSIQYATSFLSVLYPELMKQSQSLFSEGQNRLRRLYRMRTRPKIIHATTYEEAVELFDRYRANMLAVISDIGFQREGRYDAEAGLRLIDHVREPLTDLPVLLQSAESKYAARAQELHALFVNKNSPDLLYDIRRFLTDYLGFGAFIFRMPSGQEVARARDIRELAECIRIVPPDSVAYHSRRNHFSIWLRARSEFELADRIRPSKPSDFATLEDLRRYLLSELESQRRSIRTGVITDFSIRRFDPESQFQRVGEGSVGGKARSIAFLDNILSTEGHSGELAGLRVRIPQTFVLTTEFFDRFLDENELHHLSFDSMSDEQIARRFLAGRLSSNAMADLEVIVDNLITPLAVRSSSLLEDEMSHPLAGIYETVMIANNEPNPSTRLDTLCAAIKFVYASTFFRNARAYLLNISHRIDEEKMAVIIQRLVGQQHGPRFYPHFSGVASSYNYYPFPPLRPNDGMVQLALGLGRQVVEGGECVRFCPKYPAVIPQFASPALAMKSSQKGFYALELFHRASPSVAGIRATLDGQVHFDLPVAAEDGTMAIAGSIFDVQNQRVSESLEAKGPWLVTFNNILKHKAIPLAEALAELLALTTRAMATAVEIEFACDMGDWGRSVPRGQPRSAPTLYVLQVRPVRTREDAVETSAEEIDPTLVICRTGSSLGHGQQNDIRDLVYVRRESFDPARSPEIAGEIGLLNQSLAQDRRPYLLMGPGRWGSSDHWLGIPVHWSQISGAKIIVEATLPGYHVDPSQGTHFFHNITSLRLGYLTVRADPPGGRAEEFVDWDWLDAQPALRETKHLRQLRMDQPLVCRLDGHTGLGVIARPSPA